MIQLLDTYQNWLNQNTFVVPKNSVIEVPIHMTLSENSEYIFNVESNSQVTFIIEFKASLKDLETIVLTLNVKQNSHVKYVLISEEKSFKINKFLSLFFSVINEATLSFFSFLFNFLFL